MHPVGRVPVSMQIKSTQGLDIPISGKPAALVDTGKPTHSVAVLGGDYAGLRPKMLVNPGDRVSLGQPLFIDKRDPQVMFTAPGSGTVTAINRGPRRVLQSVVIELQDAQPESPQYPGFTATDTQAPSAERIRSVLLASGLWTAFRTRPFNKVPLSGSEPRSVFVTAIDTRPLAADPAPIVAAHRDAFECGLRSLRALTRGPVFVCTAPGWTAASCDEQQIRTIEFSGPHPAGLPGTHIHHLDPVGHDGTVWHIGYQDVIAIGKLFSEGRLWVERIVALGGAGFARPRMITTRLGAKIEDLVAGELLDTDAAPRLRLISGCVLNGRTAIGPEGYLGRYHLQIGAIPDGGQRRLFGWLGGVGDAYSVGGLLRRRRNPQKLLPLSTVRHGRPTAMVPVEAFERMLPMDILPVPLLRALLIGDTEQAQALGCLELDVEDLALCAFVCPGKIDYGAALRINLEQIEKNG